MFWEVLPLTNSFVSPSIHLIAVASRDAIRVGGAYLCGIPHFEEACAAIEDYDIGQNRERYEQ